MKEAEGWLQKASDNKWANRELRAEIRKSQQTVFADESDPGPLPGSDFYLAIQRMKSALMRYPVSDMEEDEKAQYKTQIKPVVASWFDIATEEDLKEYLNEETMQKRLG